MKILKLIIILIIPLGLFGESSALSRHLAMKEGNEIVVYGNYFELALPVAAGLHATSHKSSSYAREYATMMLQTHVYLYSMKYIIGRPRPRQALRASQRGKDPRDVDWVGRFHLSSFPSGHTTAAAAAATYFLWHGDTYSAIGAFVVAGFVGYSRVHAKAHYVSDVIGGAALGFAVSSLSFITTNRFSRPAQRSKVGVTILPNCISLTY